MPLVLLQLIATWIFYDRHWETVSRRLSADVAGDIAMVIDAIQLTPFGGRAAATARTRRDCHRAWRHRRIAARALPPPGPPSGTLLEKQLRHAMIERVRRPFTIDARSRPDRRAGRGPAATTACWRSLCRAGGSTRSTTYIFMLVDGRLVAGPASASRRCSCATRSSRCAGSRRRRTGSARAGRSPSPRSRARSRCARRRPPSSRCATASSARSGSAPRCSPACRTICARRSPA